MGLMRIILFLINLVFWLCGALLLGVGIWVRVDPTVTQYVDHLLPPGSRALYSGAVYALIAVGAFVFFVGFLGCCGAYRENSCMLTTYAVIIGVIILIEGAIVTLAIVFKGRLKRELFELMETQLREDVFPVTQAGSGVSKAWHFMQRFMGCCGFHNYTDYQQNTHFNHQTHPVPLSCCKSTTGESKLGGVVAPPDDPVNCMMEAKGPATIPPLQLFRKGCFESLMTFLSKRSGLLIGVGVGIAALELMGLVFACCMRKDIKNKPAQP